MVSYVANTYGHSGRDRGRVSRLAGHPAVPKPIRWILKLLLNTAIGFAALFLLNFFGSAIGITLGLNWINALVIGVAGFPGLVLLLLIKYLF